MPFAFPIMALFGLRKKIIVPIHNVEKELGKCINSILQQTYTDFECLIVYDESTDRSKEIAVRFTEQDSRVRLINQKWGE